MNLENLFSRGYIRLHIYFVLIEITSYPFWPSVSAVLYTTKKNLYQIQITEIKKKKLLKIYKVQILLFNFVVIYERT